MTAHRRLRLMLVCVSALATACTESSSDPLLSPSASFAPKAERSPQHVTFPSPEYPTLQSAVDGVANEGTIRILSGTHKANADVLNKIIRFDGQRGATLVAGDATRAIIRFGAAAGGEVRDVTFNGGTAAIEGYGKLGPLRALTLRRIVASGAAAGVVGQFEDLEIRDSHFEKMSQTAISIGEVVRLLVISSFVADARCFGLLVFNTHPRGVHINIRHSTFDRNGCGGIGVWGDAAPIAISDVSTTLNHVGGIILVGTGLSDLSRFTTRGTQPDDNGRWGDGVILWGGTSTITDGWFDLNRRVGLSVVSCEDTGLLADVTVARSLFTLNRIDLAFTQKPVGCERAAVTPHDAGGNLCVPNSPCHDSSATLVALPPPETVR